MSEDLTAWIGRTRDVPDTIRPAQVRALEATLEGMTGRAPRLGPGDALPALWHFVFFHDVEVASRLGPDGHPARGSFLPPVPLPRRMWAGGRFTFHAPLPIGAEAVRRSTVTRVEEKTGRSGRLCFVTVAHDHLVDGDLCVREEQDIVYREPPSGPAPTPPDAPIPPGDTATTRTVQPDPVTLFRYSALTFNGHRIHYDHPYATGVEGYNGLVFHGPLTATLLAGMAEEHGALASFAFRAVSPLTDAAPFQLFATGERLWAQNDEGRLAMTAEAAFREVSGR